VVLLIWGVVTKSKGKAPKAGRGPNGGKSGKPH
jgi:hypothetical protein